MLQINFHPFPKIKTERLLLREIEDSDVNEVFFLRSDKTLLKYLDKPPAKSTDEALEFISRIKKLKENNEGVNWGISLQGSNIVTGNICIWNIKPEHHRAEVGYALHPVHQNNGIMQEAMSAVLDYKFKTLHLQSIEVNVNPANMSSINLLVRNKFVREAYYKENYFFEGKFLDSAIYSLLTSENSGS